MSFFPTLNTPLGKLRICYHFNYRYPANTISLLPSQRRFLELWVHMLSLPPQSSCKVHDSGCQRTLCCQTHCLIFSPHFILFCCSIPHRPRCPLGFCNRALIWVPSILFGCSSIIQKGSYILLYLKMLKGQT